MARARARCFCDRCGEQMHRNWAGPNGEAGLVRNPQWGSRRTCIDCGAKLCRACRVETPNRPRVPVVRCADRSACGTTSDYDRPESCRCCGQPMSRKAHAFKVAALNRENHA